MERAKIKVEVAYATLQQQHIMLLEVAPGSTIETVIHLSDYLTLFPEINLTLHKVGIFGEIKNLNEIVHEGDRVEIYRPLMINPKEARKKRAEKKV